MAEQGVPSPAGGAAVSTVVEEASQPPRIVEAEHRRYERSPILLFRLVVATVVVLLGIMLAKAAEQTITDFDADLLRFFGGLPDSAERLLIGLSQFVAVIVPLVIAIALIGLRRLRTLDVAVVAAAAGALLVSLIGHVLGTGRPAALETTIRSDSWFVGAAFPRPLPTSVPRPPRPPCSGSTWAGTGREPRGEPCSRWVPSGCCRGQACRSTCSWPWPSAGWPGS